MSKELKMEQPRFPHDCNVCVFLGRWKHYDLYVCSGDVLGPTLIARYGEAGAYSSTSAQILVPHFEDMLAACAEPSRVHEAMMNAPYDGKPFRQARAAIDTLSMPLEIAFFRAWVKGLDRKHI